MTTTPAPDALSALLSETREVKPPATEYWSCCGYAAWRSEKKCDQCAKTGVRMVRLTDYSALLSEKAALAAENERLAANYQIARDAACLAGDVIRERDRRRDEVRHLRSAIAGAREALQSGVDALMVEVANDLAIANGRDRYVKRAERTQAEAAQLRALSSIGDLPAGEEG